MVRTITSSEGRDDSHAVEINRRVLLRCLGAMRLIYLPACVGHFDNAPHTVLEEPSEVGSPCSVAPGFFLDHSFVRTGGYLNCGWEHDFLLLQNSEFPRCIAVRVGGGMQSSRAVSVRIESTIPF
jgi:hypothetical protein